MGRTRLKNSEAKRGQKPLPQGKEGTSETMQLDNDSSTTHEEASKVSNQEASHSDAASPQIGEIVEVAVTTKHSDNARPISEEIRMADRNETECVERRERSTAPSSSLTSHSAADTAFPDRTQAALIKKAHIIIDMVCGADGRQPALRVRFFLAWLLGIILLAVGVTMSVVASLYMEGTKKERNKWLEANGLTRAYMLTTAPAGYVD